MKSHLKLVGGSPLNYPIRHRNSLPGYEWPVRFAWELGDAFQARSGGLRPQPASRFSRSGIAIAGER